MLQRAEAEGPHRQRLDPEGQRRLVDRHDARLVEGGEEEVVPARAHRAHGGAVVGRWPSRWCSSAQRFRTPRARAAPASSGRSSAMERRPPAAAGPGARRSAAVVGVCAGVDVDMPEDRRRGEGSPKRRLGGGWERGYAAAAAAERAPGLGPHGRAARGRRGAAGSVTVNTAPPSVGVACAHLAAVALDDRRRRSPGRGPAPARPRSRPRLRAPEALEQGVGSVGRQPGPVVADLERHPAVRRAGS